MEVVRKAVFQPAGFCIPLLRPHRHPRIPQRSVPPGTGGLFLQRSPGPPGRQQRGAQPAHRRLPELGGGLRPEPQDPHRVGGEGPPQRGSCPARATPDGEARRLRRVLHFQEHGTGTHVPHQRTEVSHPGSQPPHPGPPAEPLHPLLLLHSGRGAGADHRSHGQFLSIPRHLLAQRAFLHGTGTPARRRWLSQKRQCFPHRGRRRGFTGRRRPTESRDHPQATRLLDTDSGPEVLQKGARPDEPVAVLRHRPDRVLPEFHFQAPLPHPQNLRAQLRDRPLAADGQPHQRDLWRPA